MEETGIKSITERPYQCDDKGYGQTEPELAQGNDPCKEEYDGCI
jgi:hypothetical protein